MLTERPVCIVCGRKVIYLFVSKLCWNCEQLREGNTPLEDDVNERE